MEATILDVNFQPVGVIDSYKSFIWTDRYNECGDFEIALCLEYEIPSFIQKGHYVWIADSEHTMIIESIKIENDNENGDCLIISGRSLESILDRRIVWNKKVFLMDSEDVMPKVEKSIRTLILENIVNAVEPRQIPNFTFEYSEDERIEKLEFEGEYLGQDLLEIVSTLCKEHDMGFKITLNDSNQFVFQLYMGVDHSYGDETEQNENTYVIFSPEYNNIKNINYIDSDEPLKNVTLIVGESKYDSDGKVISRLDWEVGNSTGLERREIYTDATSLTMDDGYGGTMTAERYKALLKQKGIDTLIDNTASTAFDGELDPSDVYEYGQNKDYYIGDIVQIIAGYGLNARAYISEYIRSCDESGINAYPTFKFIEKGVYE